jgi:protein TonB
MRWITLIIGCCLICGLNSVSGQQKSPDYVYMDSEVDSLPEFPGGKAAMMNHVQEGIKNVDQDACVGILVVSFIVEKNGKISHIKIVRSLCKQADEAVIAMIKNMPEWKAGKKENSAVRVKINMPIRFIPPQTRLEE